MKLVLVRHGNTFGPGDPVVWTGASNDLPLVEKGFEQAHAVGAALGAAEKPMQHLYSSGLLRCRTAADIIATYVRVSAGAVQIDDRLAELDLGSWTGLTNEEVIAAGGEKEQTAWNERSEWPQGVFGGSEAAIKADVTAFARELKSSTKEDDLVVAVSSNGRIRYFLTLIPGAFEAAVAAGTFKVKTGNMCLLEYKEGEWSCHAWNVKPEEFPAL